MAEVRRLVVVGRAEPIPVEPKAHLLEALQGAGVPIATSCGGVGTCGLCRVTVEGGAEHLSARKGVEEHHLGNVAAIVGLRLACQARFASAGEVRVVVPEVDDVQERRRRKLERVRSSGREEKLTPPRSKAARIEWRPRKLEGLEVREAGGESRATPVIAGAPRVSKRPTSG